ncbi:hypothetical protein [Nonomuraea sp. bgisy101]|uniref:hypothetical protein n=1 Tax=Nonomuraea sp. bgisy101 TaxID=3413784 RepID=UPI003D74A0BF
MNDVDPIAGLVRRAARASKRIEWHNRLVRDLELTRERLRRATRLIEYLTEAEPPPLEYVTAVRSPRRGRFQQVAVTIDGSRCVIGLRGTRSWRGHEADDWRRTVDVVRRVRAGGPGGTGGPGGPGGPGRTGADGTAADHRLGEGELP